jgi:transcriptional regulator with XRE-family HTH domain
MKQDVIKTTRQMIGLRQAQLAGAASVNSARLSQIENGIATASEGELKRIERCLMDKIAQQLNKLSGLLAEMA